MGQFSDKRTVRCAGHFQPNDIRIIPLPRCTFTRPRGGIFFSAPALESCGSPGGSTPFGRVFPALPGDRLWRTAAWAAEAGYDRR